MIVLTDDGIGMETLPEGTGWLPLRSDGVDMRLHLLPVPADDDEFIEDLWLIRNFDLETAVSSGTRPKGQTRTQIREMFEARLASPDFHYAIALVTESLDRDLGSGGSGPEVRYVGLITGVWCDEVSRVIEIGISVFSDWRGQRIAARTLDLFSARLWNLFRVRKLVARVLVGNEPSRKLFEAAGFRTVGRLEQHHFIGGRFHDMIIYEKLLSAERT